MSIASSVATFYWRLTGVINQDIPPDTQGRPLEFCRYVSYFLDRYPEFKEVPCLMLLVTDVYLDALNKGEEPRLMVRKASHRASVVHRRVKHFPQDAFLTLNDERRASLRDAMAAILLDHGEHLLKHWFGDVIEPATLSVSGSDITESWLRELETYLLAPQNGIQKLRQETGKLVPPAPEGFKPKLLDQTEAMVDGISGFFSLLMKRPLIAFMRLFREIKSAPRLIPTWIYFSAIVPFFAWFLIEAAIEIHTLADVLIFGASVFIGLWIADAVSYVIHMDRDGWGSSVETRAFQDHHIYPGEAGLWTIRRSVGTVAHGVLILMVLLFLLDVHPMLQLGIGVMLFSFLFVTWTHRWAHTPKNQIPRWIRLMQKYRLIISVEFHSIHHTSLDKSWGIFNGWSCFFFDAIRFHELHTHVRNWLFDSGRPLWEQQIADRKSMKLSVP